MSGKIRLIRWLLAALGTWLLIGWETGTLSAQLADLVIRGGKVITLDETQPEAEAIAIRGNRILAVGSSQAVAPLVGSGTKVIELEPGQTVIPGLIEGHGHYLGLGQSLMMLNLAKARTWEEIVTQVEVAARVTPPGQWIIGRGWHQSKWDTPPESAVGGYPTAEALSRVAPNHPVLLTHASGHMSIANDYALRLGEVTPETIAPEGGEILKLADGRPTGVLRERAQELVTRALVRDQAKQSVEQRAADFARAIELAGKECLRYGITSFQDAGSSVETIRELRRYAAAGKLPVRLWAMVRDDLELIRQQAANLKMVGYGEQFLTVAAVKLSIDGALGPHGAWLLAPYADLPGSVGLNTIPLETVQAAAEFCATRGFQLCVHAIGDRANRETLDIFEATLQKYPSRTPRRWRIEHAQHLHPDDIPRFGSLGIIAAMQGVHCTSDAIFVPQRLGQLRAEQGAYVWRSLLDSGAVVTNGTDAPVEELNPFPSLYASVTRQLPNGLRFFPKQVMTREEALRSYTIDSAYAAFEEHEKGSLVAGKLADLAVLDRNLLTCAAEEISGTRVLYTLLGGKVVYTGETEPR